MKNKGFTLIELLGVIVLLSLLMIIVFPNIINSVKKASDKTDRLTIDLISNAADIYIADNPNLFSKKQGKKYSIELKDLVDKGLLISPIKLSDSEDITNNKCIQVVYNEGYKYLLKDKGLCEKMCMPVTIETKTIGNVPLNDGTYRAGDEYLCEVDPNKPPYRFFVLTEATDSNNVNMIMYANINSVGIPVDNSSISDIGTTAWGVSGNNDYGPVYAMTYLKNATNNWTNLTKQTIKSFNDDIDEIYDMTAIETYARLPYYSELGIYESGVNEYLFNYLEGRPNSVGVSGYWTFTADSSAPTKALFLSNVGIIDRGAVASSVIGVRPVITVKTSDIG